MKKLYILGAGGMGREVCELVLQDPSFLAAYNLVGFIDDNLNALRGYSIPFSVIGTTDYPFESDAHLICAIANPKVKEKLYKKLSSLVSFVSYVHPTSIVFNSSIIEEGVVVYPNVFISSNTKIGRLVILNLGSQIGHDASIGNFSSLMCHVDVGGGAQLGRRCFMGTQSCLLPQKCISDDVTIGIGSVAIRNLKKAGTYYGNPALKID